MSICINQLQILKSDDSLNLFLSTQQKQLEIIAMHYTNEW